MTNRYKFIVLIILFVGVGNLFAQEGLVPLSIDYRLYQNKEANQQADIKGGQRAQTPWPFTDDFAYEGMYPSPNLWINSGVCIGDNIQANPLSYGTAIFNGLNQYGLPYNYPGLNQNYGPADTLTSQPINLFGKNVTDSIVFSFYYQAQGIGDYPNEEDTLILEFKQLNNWVEVWHRTGSDTMIDNPVFYTTSINVNNPFYFVDSFQFRFRNYASIAGNNDHWLLDYVYLDENRGSAQDNAPDVSVVTPFESFLSPYTSMPWRQFKNNRVDEMDSIQYYSVRNNNDTLDKQVDRHVLLIDSTSPSSLAVDYDFQTILALTAQTSRTDPIDLKIIEDGSNIGILNYSPPQEDSVVLCFNQNISEVNVRKLFSKNDSICNCAEFYNYLAYDDGTPEKAYGLQGPGLKKFAYQYHVNEPDTIRGLYIHFTSINSDVEGMELEIVLWKDIDRGNTGIGDDTMAILSGREIYFRQDGKNGFSLFEFDEPEAISDTFYVGIIQGDQRNTQIGFDLNNVATPYMYVFANDVWTSSIYFGAPMIRPILGPTSIPLYSSTDEPEKLLLGENEPLLYPNPVESTLYIKNYKRGVEMMLFDLSGKLMKHEILENNTIDVSKLQAGMYIIQLINPSTKNTYSNKFVKMD